MNTKPLVIYHGNCADGFGAAWAVREAHRTFNLQYQPEELVFHAGVYQKPPPDVTDMDVIMVDFSYKRPVLLEMAEKAHSIIILDHHKTAEADLVDLPKNVNARFDMEQSGAMLAWNFYFAGSGILPPRLLKHIEDRDLWRFKLEHTREIQAALFSFPYDFEVWDKLMFDQNWNPVAEGQAIERKHFKDIKELVAVTMQWWEIAGYKVPVANLPYTFSSDAGHYMWETNGAPFAACYWDTPTGRTFSLRSRPDFDCSAIAKQYGGGGHKNAAGFSVNKQHPLSTGVGENAKGGTAVLGDIQQSPSR